MESREESSDAFMTSQMLTLGLDASDDRSPKRSVEMVDSNSAPERNTATWWNRAFHSADGGLDSRVAAAIPDEMDRPRVSIDEVDTEYLYAQMGDHLSTASTNARENGDPRKTKITTMQQGLRKFGGTLNKLHNSLILNPQRRRLLSDRSHMILRDGHFYYSDMESAVASRRDVEPNCNYFQAPSTAVHPELKRYREQFEDLNKDAKRLELALLVDSDLQLDTDDDLEVLESQLDARNSILRTVETSSLYYEVEGGGMTLLCLPRDHVRLTMDPELQSGTLAVEQWRRGDETGHEIALSRRPSCSFCPGCKKEFTFGRDFSIHPDLRYTLVVSDDLYRNLISELSSHLTEPYCGINRWCLDDEKVDIRVAIGVLTIVLSLMFVTTIEWPTQ